MQEEEARYAEEMAESESEEGGGMDFGMSLFGLLAAMIVSAIVITVEVALGADYSSHSRGGGGGGFVPEVEIID